MPDPQSNPPKIVQPNPAYRENPARGVFLSGNIGQPTLDALTPKIIDFRTANSAPLTLYIDSNGGSVGHAGLLYQILKAPSQDGDVCALITVATGTAASAAADLLAMGDYAIAYPGARILFHGTRRLPDEDVTEQSAASIAVELNNMNESSALTLATYAAGRFFLRYVVASSEFAALKEALSKPQLTPVECIAHFLGGKVPRVGPLILGALDQHRRLSRLEAFVHAKMWKRKRSKLFKTDAERDKFLLDCITEHEVKEHRRDRNWSFSGDSLRQLQQDFAALIDYRLGSHTAPIQQLIARWGQFVLDPAQVAEMQSQQPSQLNDWLANASGERIHQLWYFFVSICRLLQKAENWLTPEEAYWLGLLDEVCGSGFPCLRVLAEASPTPTAS